GIGDIQQQVFLERQEIRIVADQNVRIDFNVHSRIHETKQANARGRILHPIVLLESSAKLLQRVSNVVGCKIVAKPNGLAKEDFVALAEIFNDDVRNRAVRYGEDVALLGAEFGGAKADVFDRATLVADAAGVSDQQCLVG